MLVPVLGLGKGPAPRRDSNSETRATVAGQATGEENIPGRGKGRTRSEFERTESSWLEELKERTAAERERERGGGYWASVGV